MIKACLELNVLLTNNQRNYTAYEMIAADDSYLSYSYNIALYREQCNPDSTAQNHFNYVTIVLQ